MHKWLRELAFCFSAGSIGALAKSGAIWLCAHFAAGNLVSHLTNAQYPAGIYARIVWGGVAAFLFLLPIARGNWIVRGLLWGIIVALLQAFAIPLLDHANLHFALVPLLSVLVLGCIWGLAAAIALRLFGT
jgi:hypothetical protein